MSDTPRTDAEIRTVAQHTKDGVRSLAIVSIEFTRTLERELSEKDSRIAELESRQRRCPGCGYTYTMAEMEELRDQRDTATRELAEARKELAEVKRYAGLTEADAQTTLATEEQKEALQPLKQAGLQAALRQKTKDLDEARTQAAQAVDQMMALKIELAEAKEQREQFASTGRAMYAKVADALVWTRRFPVSNCDISGLARAVDALIRKLDEARAQSAKDRAEIERLREEAAGSVKPWPMTMNVNLAPEQSQPAGERQAVEEAAEKIVELSRQGTPKLAEVEKVIEQVMDLSKEPGNGQPSYEQVWSLAERLSTERDALKAQAEEQQKLIAAKDAWIESHFELCDCRAEDQFTCARCAALTPDISKQYVRRDKTDKLREVLSFCAGVLRGARPVVTAEGSKDDNLDCAIVEALSRAEEALKGAK